MAVVEVNGKLWEEQDVNGFRVSEFDHVFNIELHEFNFVFPKSKEASGFLFIEFVYNVT